MESFYAQGGLLILLPLCTMYRGGGGGRTVYNPTLFLLSLLRATDEISSPERRRVAASLSGDGGRRRRRRRKSRSIFRGGGSKKGGRGGGYLSFPDTRNRGKYSTAYTVKGIIGETKMRLQSFEMHQKEVLFWQKEMQGCSLDKHAFLLSFSFDSHMMLRKVQT